MRHLVLCTQHATSFASYAAEAPIQSSTLQFSNITHDSWYQLPEGPVGLQVLSDTAGATTITTPAWETAVDLWVGGSHALGDTYRLSMDLTPKAGYRITGFSFLHGLEHLQEQIVKVFGPCLLVLTSLPCRF